MIEPYSSIAVGQSLQKLAMRMINYLLNCWKIHQKSVTISPIFEQIFPVLNKLFTCLKSLVFGHYLFCFISISTEYFIPRWIPPLLSQSDLLKSQCWQQVRTLEADPVFVENSFIDGFWVCIPATCKRLVSGVLQS